MTRMTPKNFSIPLNNFQTISATTNIIKIALIMNMIFGSMGTGEVFVMVVVAEL